jgi:hypothetical protein
MKKIAFLVLFTIGLSQYVNSQCTTTATGFGNNTSTTMYNVLGTVQVVLNANNSVTVNLMSNFSTASGPDVRIFLVDRGTLTNAQLKIPAMFNARPKIEMGISPVSGVASFTKAIPPGMNISDFETVYFYCQSFSQFWDFGSFTPFTNLNCALLETNDFENNKLQLYPNPVTRELNIQLEDTTTNYKVTIYNVLGVLVYESSNQKSNASNSINISELNSGIYFVKITDDKNKIYQKRLIKK